MRSLATVLLLSIVACASTPIAPPPSAVPAAVTEPAPRTAAAPARPSDAARDDAPPALETPAAACLRDGGAACREAGAHLVVLRDSGLPIADSEVTTWLAGCSRHPSADCAVVLRSLCDSSPDGSSGSVPAAAPSCTATVPVSDAQELSESQRSLLRGNMKAILACYEARLRASPGLKGKLSVHLAVDPDGSLRRVGLKGSTLRDVAVATCVLAEVSSWRFTPAPEATEVTLPFVFMPGG